jgi:hypothetical protein
MFRNITKKRISNFYFKEDETMDISSVGANSSNQYETKNVGAAQENVKSTSDSEKKDLGVIVELSKDSPEAKRLSEIVQNKGKSTTSEHRIIHGDNVDGIVSFYGASVTKEQSEKLQSVIQDLEEQPNGNLGDSWNVGAYAQLGLKVSQLSYACKEMGLSDDAAEQVTSAYGKQAEEKINKVNSLMDAVAMQMKVEKEKFYKMVEEKGENPYKTKSRASNNTGKSSVELNQEANSDIYNMFSNLDVSSKEKFVGSFENAVDSFKNYYAGGEVQIFTGTDKEQSQLDELVKRFQSFLEA